MPDYFLYENNKSAALAIKDQISAELGAPLHYINSALVSAQNQQRFYVHNFGDIGQPEDRGIVLDDILDSSEGEMFYKLEHVAKGARCVAILRTYRTPTRESSATMMIHTRQRWTPESTPTL